MIAGRNGSNHNVMTLSRYVAPRRSAWPVPLLILFCACSAGVVPGRPPSPQRVAALEADLGRGANTDRRIRLAAAYRASGRPAAAVPLLQQVTAGGSRDPAALFLLGLSCEESGRLTEARQAYQDFLGSGGPPDLERAARDRIVLLERRELEQAVHDAIAQEAALQASVPDARALGVFPFLYAGADSSLAPLGRAFAELLSTDLALTDRITIVERARVQYLLDELRLAATGAVDPATGARAGHMVGAGRIVQGQLQGSASALSVNARVISVLAGRDTSGAPLEQQGQLSRLFDLEKQVALGVYSALGVQLTVAERERVLQHPTDNVQALLAFGLGLEDDDADRWGQAAARFRAALTLDANFALARLALERAEAKQRASQRSASSLAQLADMELGWELPGWMRRRLRFVEVDPMIPDPELRNPSTEALGLEGLDRRARVIVIVRPPGSR